MTKDKNTSRNTVALDALAEQINIGHRSYLATARRALDHALAVGAALLEARAGLPHGEWLPWLKANCPAISERSAQRYIRLARNRDKLSDKSATVADLTVRQAEKVLSETSLVPPDGHALVASWPGGQAHIWPSSKHSGYYFGNVIYDVENEGESVAEGTKRPVRGDALSLAFGPMLSYFMPATAKFTAIPAEPWSYNVILGPHDPLAPGPRVIGSGGTA